jgi:hypothetical protein
VKRVSHTAPLWRWTGNGPASWFFLTISGEAGAMLSATAVERKLEGLSRGFGSLKVIATIGETSWKTSVFPSKGEGWLLPVKKAVRRAEDLAEGDQVAVVLEV